MSYPKTKMQMRPKKTKTSTARYRVPGDYREQEEPRESLSENTPQTQARKFEIQEIKGEEDKEQNGLVLGEVHGNVRKRSL